MDHVSFTPGPWTVAEEFLATLPNELAEAPRKDRLNEFRKFVTKLQPDIEAGYLIPDQTSAFLLETATRMCAPDEAPAIEEIVRDMMMPLTFREAEEPPVDRGNVPLVDSLDAYGERRPDDTAVTNPEQPPPAILDEWDAGDDLDLPQPRGWLLGNQFCRGFLSGLLAPGATGKSAVRLVQFMALATGRPLSGQHVFQRSRVLLVSLEDDRDELRRRIAAARVHHRVDHAELKGWLYCWTPKGIKLAEIKDNARQKGQLETLIRTKIATRKFDLVALDPFIKLHTMEENDNTAMDFVCDLLVKITAECNVAVDTPHHTKKGQIAAGDPDAGRGASSQRDAGRLLYTLTRMTEEEAKAFNIPFEKRALYVRLDSSKVNIAPPSQEATWFKLVGVKLGNGTAQYPNGDEVQTVEPWHPPKTWDGVSSHQLNAALTDIAAGLSNGQRFSDGSKATTRAAWPVIQRYCPDRNEDQCREIIRIWIKNGVLFSEDYDDPVERKSRKGLRVCDGKRPS